MLASLVLGFAMFGALSGFMVVWLHSMPMRPCLDVAIRDASPWCRLLRAHLSLFRSMRRLLTILFCATHWLYVHLYMLVYMFMHESCLLVCRPCFNTMRLWISDPNLHLSITDTTICLLSSLFTLCLLFAVLLVCPFACMFARILYAMLVIAILLVHFAPFCYYLCISPFPLLIYWFLVFAFACIHMEWGHIEIGRDLLGTSKKGSNASLPTWVEWLCSVGLGFSFSLWLCTLLNPFFLLP